MPQLTPYFLSFRSGLHLGAPKGQLGESAAWIPADTLFASLVDVWRRSGADPGQFVAPFAARPADPPFLLTSAFPFAGGVRFYPMPIDLARLFHGATLKQRGKEIKRIRYCSEALLRRALSGAALDEWLFPVDEHETPTTGVTLQGGALWLTGQEVERLPQAIRLNDAIRARPHHALRKCVVFAADRVPRVTVDRVNSSSTIYHAGRTTFGPGCGLWFGVQWRAANGAGESWQARVGRMLALLGDDGLGGERSSGYGGFAHVAGDAFHLPDTHGGRPTLLLSRYHPTAEETTASLNHPAAAYGLSTVAGWLRSPDAVGQRRKRLALVSEGSIVCPPHTPAGDVVDVGPEYGGGAGVSHPVYRYGLALGVDASKLSEARHG